QLAALRLDPKLSGAVEECRRITAEIQAELAALIEPGAERDAGADERPFSEEIQDRADTWARRGGFDLSTRLEAADGMPAAQRATVLRVLDEAMANIMRHSGAASALVEVRRRGKSFELRVDDDGRGLGQAVDGVGVGAMRRRASELPNGRLLLTDASPG